MRLLSIKFLKTVPSFLSLPQLPKGEGISALLSFSCRKGDGTSVLMSFSCRKGDGTSVLLSFNCRKGDGTSAPCG